MPCVTILAFAFSIYYYYPTVANPVQADSRVRETDEPSESMISPKAWIPMVVVVVLLIIVALLAWSKNSFRKAFAPFVRVGASMSNNPTSGGERELTAEQLVGSDSTSELPAPRQPRRNRRARRTPSQISVTSLPAYNKEPGEEELVIFRGRDMEEDATMLSPIVAEEEQSSLISQDRSQLSRYAPLPIPTTNEMPFLHDGELSGDLSLPTLLSSDARRSSYDSSQEETRSLMRIDSNLPQESPDPRGQAPAYFEVVDLTQESNPGLPTTQPSSIPSSTSPEPQQQQRRSGFRTFLNRMSMMSHVPEHRRAESDQSFSSNGHRPNRSIQSRTSTNHRPSHSSSNPSIFHTLSRQRSNQTLNSSSIHLNSPSLISLNSISSPLSHTLIRTEFTYPKSGPTPEQLKVISSRENFSRFGVPYGPDAIAFAASSSRQDLEPPPPDFEASSSQLSLIRPGLSGQLESSGSVVGDTQDGRPSISEPVSEGERAEEDCGTPQSSLSQPENAPNVSTPSSTHNESSAASIPKVPANPISLTDPSSSSTSLLPPTTNEFGKLYTSSLEPQGTTATSRRSESRASNHSFQSYATAPESGYFDSGPSTPKLEG